MPRDSDGCVSEEAEALSGGLSLEFEFLKEITTSVRIVEGRRQL
jgi:hypothetical protein